MKLKILDWKSFAIGVLLTTTIVLGTGASKEPTVDLLKKLEIIPWDANQQWEYKTSNTKNIPKPELIIPNAIFLTLILSKLVLI